jgi:hypothetical protein
MQRRRFLTCATGDVQAPHPTMRIQFPDIVILPYAMDTQRHRVVHYIVGRGHGREDGSDWPRRADKLKGFRRQKQTKKKKSVTRQTKSLLNGLWHRPKAKMSRRARFTSLRVGGWARLGPG